MGGRERCAGTGRARTTARSRCPGKGCGKCPSVTPADASAPTCRARPYCAGREATGAKSSKKVPARAKCAPRGPVRSRRPRTGPIRAKCPGSTVPADLWLAQLDLAEKWLYPSLGGNRFSSMAGFSVVAHGAACQRRHELRILPAVNFRRSRDAIKAPRPFLRAGGLRRMDEKKSKRSSNRCCCRKPHAKASEPLDRKLMPFRPFAATWLQTSEF